MNMGSNLKVGHTDNGLTLLQFLSDRLGVSRNKAKDIIDRRCVFVNDRRIWMARHRVKTGDNITGCQNFEKQLKIGRAGIIYEDQDYLIVNKPTGISSNGPNSVEELLNRQSGNESAAACHTPRVACHRLDKDTSGCLIFAKHGKAKESIIPVFANNKINKKYEAIILGRLPVKSMTITKPIDGQKAITHLRVVDAQPRASHVSISIETGRTHQIRKHMAQIGHPVLGDQHYGVNRAVSGFERSVRRQMLHAAEIAFRQPLTGAQIRCRASLPEDIRVCLKACGLK